MVDVRCRGRRAAVLFLAVGLLVPASASDASSKLVQELDAATTEEGATTLLAPYMDKLKELRPEVVEKVVMRQWWVLARELVAKSHTQSVDLSAAVRKSVRFLKEEADELLRTLNPKYGQAQQVSPAFQWAQNDTSIFLTIKYTVRWNAPGALEVTEPSVNMSGNLFNFSGLGKHSNNKYKYSLSLGMFDDIDGERSIWSAASVGKLSVTLRKKWGRKWPRLLANKKTKIGNMHVWSERQDNLEGTLSGMSTVSNSPVTCKANEKLYCLATDTCKKPDKGGCAQCPGKPIPQEEGNLCTGLPSEKASLSFKDTDMDENEIAGEVKITRARNDFDVDSYDIYWGKDDNKKLELPDGTKFQLASVAATGADTEVRLPHNTPIPEGATHLLVFSKNTFGEYVSPGSTIVTDAVLPKGKPTSLRFEDEDADKNEVSGTVTIGRADPPTGVEEYALYWGKNDRKKISSGAQTGLRDVRKNGDRDPTHHISSNTKIPDGATHLLVFAKNTWGEHPGLPISLKLVDSTKPCLKKGSPDCPQGVTATPDSNPAGRKVQATITIEPAQLEDNLSHYAVYFGRQNCANGGMPASGAKSGHIKDVPVGEALQFELDPGLVVASTTNHVLVFAKNKYGEADTCVDAAFKDYAAGAEL